MQITRREDLHEFICSLRHKGVTLWVEDGVLRYRARKGVLAEEERQMLQGADGALISLVRCGLPSMLVDETQIVSDQKRLAPLSFVQLAHWNFRRREADGRPVRQVASATRLRGRLHVEVLREAVAEVVRRHDALRTQIVCGKDRCPLQEVTRGCHSELEVVSITSLPPSRMQETVEYHIKRAIFEPVDYAVSPLFRAMLVSFGDSENALILALDHIISDGVSLNILSEETLTAYSQLFTKSSVKLPKVLLQFPDYAVRQRAHSASEHIEARRRGSSFCRTRFPSDATAEAGAREGWGVVRLVIGRDLRDELRSWALRNRTTLVMAVFTAYCALVLRWCGVEEAVIQFETDGRMSPEVGRTVGAFAFALYVNAAVDGRDTFIDLLRRLTSDYCRACDEADFGHAYAQVPRPGFTRNTVFNWLPPSDASQSGILVGGQMLSCSRIGFDHPLLGAQRADGEPWVVFTECGDLILGEVGYPRDRFSHGSMSRFAGNLTTFLSSMVQAPAVHVKDMRLT